LIENPSRNLENSFLSLKKVVNETGSGHYLLYSNDGHLKLISNYYDEINQLFRVALPSKEIIDASLDKLKFNKLAKEYEMPVADTFYSEQKIAAADIRFPVVFKPLTRVNWFNSKIIKELKSKTYKAIYVNSESEYSEYVKKFREENIEYIIQQFIPGPESNILSFHGFFSQNSEPLGYYIGKKIRTYPIQYGRSCLLELIKHQELADLSIDILKNINFVGPVKLDYKIDENTGKIFLLEMNPRFNLWNYLGAKAGVNLPYLAYKYYTNELDSSKPVISYSTDIKWINLKQDFLAYKELSQLKSITFLQWLKSIRGKKVYQIFAINDLLPFFYTIFDTFKGGLNKLKRVIKK